MDPTLTPDAQAVLLLCGELGRRREDGPKPLSLRQYNALAQWLRRQGLRPGDLLTSEGRARLADCQTADVDAGHVASLLARGAGLAVMLERWERGGLWVISRSDADYPERLKRYLGSQAPPLFYGVGLKRRLDVGGLAIVGSRDRSDEDGRFAYSVGGACARQDIAVISGAAKGIDRDAMTGALDVGGHALGVLAEGLAKTATSGQYRSGLVSDRLTLISPYDPESRWLPYAAMERNKLLYGLSDGALVVASAADSGGTWAGATEALEYRRVKVFVKSTGPLAPGNEKLLRMGGLPFPAEPWDDLRVHLKPLDDVNGHLFAEAGPQSAFARLEPTAPLLSPPDGAAEEAAIETGPGDPPHVGVPAEAEAETVHFFSGGSVGADEPPHDAYLLVIQAIVALLEEPRSDDWLAQEMHVRPAQIKDWLDRGVREGRVLKLKKPARYVAQASGLFAK